MLHANSIAYKTEPIYLVALVNHIVLVARCSVPFANLMATIMYIRNPPVFKFVQQCNGLQLHRNKKTVSIFTAVEPSSLMECMDCRRRGTNRHHIKTLHNKHKTCRDQV